MYFLQIIRKHFVLYVITGSLLFSAFPVLAETTVILKSGVTIKGDIIEKTDDSVHMKVLGSEITYYADEIDSVDGQKIDSKNDLPAKAIETASERSPGTDTVEETFKGIVADMQGFQQGITKASDCREFFRNGPGASVCVNGSGPTVPEVTEEYKSSFLPWAHSLQKVVSDSPASKYSDDAEVLANHLKNLADGNRQERMPENSQLLEKYPEIVIEPWSIEHLPSFIGTNSRYELKNDICSQYFFSKDLNDWKKAKDCYSEALTIFPDDAPRINKLLDLIDKKIAGVIP